MNNWPAVDPSTKPTSRHVQSTKTLKPITWTTTDLQGIPGVSLVLANMCQEFPIRNGGIVFICKSFTLVIVVMSSFIYVLPVVERLSTAHIRTHWAQLMASSRHINFAEQIQAMWNYTMLGKYNCRHIEMSYTKRGPSEYTQ